MDRWINNDVVINQRMVHAKHAFIKKWCGCMSLRGGSAFASFVWLGLNLYLTVLSFQARSPIYSNLNFNALMVTGVICLMFCLGSLFSLFALFVNRPQTIRMAHQLTWLVVFAYLTDAFINIIVYGVLRDDFQSWCLNRSRSYVDEEITAILGNGTQITMSFNPSQAGVDLYNCQKMWEDELKLGIVVWLILAIVYLYWATCLWSYSQKKRYFEMYTHALNNQPNVMMNLPPGADIHEAAWNESHGKSMAEGVREIYAGLRAILNRNRVPPEGEVKFG